MKQRAHPFRRASYSQGMSEEFLRTTKALPTQYLLCKQSHIYVLWTLVQ
jgi:hypothetical protein